MEIFDFDIIQDKFMRRVCSAVYCNMATVDRKNRPRSRIIHPIWDGPIGWLITWPESHKAKHLKSNPHVSLAYISDINHPVYVECVGEWTDDPYEKQRIWVLHQAAPPPLGFDPQPHYGSIDHPHYGLLKFTPWRIELAELPGESIIWRQELTFR